MLPIKTERLILRRFEPADAADLFAYLHRPSQPCFLSMALADPAAAEAEVVRRADAEDAIAVALKESGRLIGDLFATFEEPDTWSIGWNFNPAFGGAGYAVEAAQALVAHLFRDRNARRLYAYVEDDNRPSQRLCDRLGMRQEGLFRDFVSFETDPDGRPIHVDTRQYALLRREWAG